MSTPEDARQIAVIFVGNRLMKDDGIGPAAYDLFLETYEVPEDLLVREVGCMTFDMIPLVDKLDFIITVDAVDGTNKPAGTAFRFSPEDMARHSGAMASLHELKLVDLFDAAALLDYSCQGICLGMQVENRDPVEFDMTLSAPCEEALPLLVELVEAELFRQGVKLTKKA